MQPVPAGNYLLPGRALRSCNSAPRRAHRSTRCPGELKRALTLGAQQPRNTAIDSTTDQMGAATPAVVRALRVRTVTWSELHGSLLMQTVCHASGGYSERSGLSLAYIYTRYRGTAPKNTGMPKPGPCFLGR